MSHVLELGLASVQTCINQSRNVQVLTYSKQGSGLSHLGSEGFHRILFWTRGVWWVRVGEGRGKGICTRQHTKAGTEKRFLSTCCSLSFIAGIFEQKLTVQRNPRLAPLHFQLLFYSLFLHLGPSYLHNEKKFGGEEGHVSISKGLPCQFIL